MVDGKTERTAKVDRQGALYWRVVHRMTEAKPRRLHNARQDSIGTYTVRAFVDWGRIAYWEAWMLTICFVVNRKRLMAKEVS